MYRSIVLLTVRRASAPEWFSENKPKVTKLHIAQHSVELSRTSSERACFYQPNYYGFAIATLAVY
jgi:hypothetical protein